MEKKSNSGLLALVIILGLAVCGLGGYIAYDKLNEPKQTVPDTNQDDKEPQKVNVANLYKSVDLDYAINGKIVKVGFNYTIEKDNEASDEDWEKPYKIYVTLSFDGKINEIKKYLVDAYKTENECKSSNIYDIVGRDNLHIIKGSDKEYFVFYVKEFTEAAPRRTLNILGSDGTLIHNVEFEMGNSVNVPNDKYGEYEMYYLTNDALYYIDNSCYGLRFDGDNVIVDEYKIVVKNDKITKEKTNTYTATSMAGQSC